MKRDYSPENVTISFCNADGEAVTIKGFADGEPFADCPLVANDSRGLEVRNVTADRARQLLIVGDYSALEERVLNLLNKEGNRFEVIHVGTNTQSPDANNERALADMRKIGEIMAISGMRCYDGIHALPYQVEKPPKTHHHGPRDKWGKLK
jgi:hypothetical protein